METKIRRHDADDGVRVLVERDRLPISAGSASIACATSARSRERCDDPEMHRLAAERTQNRLRANVRETVKRNGRANNQIGISASSQREWSLRVLISGLPLRGPSLTTWIPSLSSTSVKCVLRSWAFTYSAAMSLPFDCAYRSSVPASRTIELLTATRERV